MIFWHESSATEPGGTARDGRVPEPGAANIPAMPVAGHGYVLADQSGRYAPIEWARTAIALYRQHKADRIVAEVNNGGDMVEATVRMVDRNVSYSAVRVSRGKVIRAEPVAALYEQRRI